MTFTQDNTAGYTDEQLAAFNAEFDERIASESGGVVDYDERVAIFKALADDISSR